MFDIAWSHILLIGIVALLVVGPKDLPRVLRSVGVWAGRARAVAREFRGNLDQIVREAELQELRQNVEQATKLDIENPADPASSLPKFRVAEPAADTTLVTPVAAPKSGAQA